MLAIMRVVQAAGLAAARWLGLANQSGLCALHVKELAHRAWEGAAAVQRGHAVAVWCGGLPSLWSADSVWVGNGI